ncbi:MAG: C39 family peptidase [Gemmatimonadota bacterium]
MDRLLGPDFLNLAPERPLESSLELEILPQPDDTTCGPTCLHAVYNYFAHPLPVDQIIREVVPLSTRGTLAVLLGLHALRRGYQATLYTYNLHVFDPTWFSQPGMDLSERLAEQARAKSDDKLHFVTGAYREFLALGGDIRFRELSPELIREYLKKGIPILTGLSATYLYGCAREMGDEQMRYDDIEGEPQGHFVVLAGYDPESRKVRVADPLHGNPAYGEQHYDVGMQRLLGSILLGVLTYDANMLVIQPGNET